ncbi:MAG: class A beta-lactamase-related serine hydrolase [Candidatus Zixiibacteriota bacterium]|nr:MAG: class A beta-lactamase-related serine hydrolase [candidate division Zixibacteria bacterium]
MKGKILIGFLLAWMVPALASAEALTDSLGAFIAREMQVRQIPGLALAVVRGGQPAIVRAYGQANLETGAPLTASSVFEIASLTKPITATAVMLLVEDGKVGLDDPVGEYLDSLPAAWAGITVRHLLTHTSGLPEEAVAQHDGSPLMNVSIRQQYEAIRQAELLFAPGEKACYSDPGYFLLGMIIERVSEQTYGEFLRDRLFTPLGMTASRVQDQRKIIPGRVAPYTLREGELCRGRRDWQHDLPAHYGVLSTVEDLAKFEAALRAGTLLKPATLEQMRTSARLNDGREAIIWGDLYGFGWKVGEVRGRPIVEHGGFTGTHLLRFLDRDLAVIVLTNLDVASGSRPEWIARGVAGIVDPELKPVAWEAPQKDPSPRTTRAVQKLVEQMVAGSEPGVMTAEHRAFYAALPADQKAGLVEVLQRQGKFTFVACDEIPPGSLTRTGRPVARICYYRSEDARGKPFFHAFYLTETGEVAWMRLFRG